MRPLLRPRRQPWLNNKTFFISFQDASSRVLTRETDDDSDDDASFVASRTQCVKSGFFYIVASSAKISETSYSLIVNTITHLSIYVTYVFIFVVCLSLSFSLSDSPSELLYLIPPSRSIDDGAPARFLSSSRSDDDILLLLLVKKSGFQVSSSR